MMNEMNKDLSISVMKKNVEYQIKFCEKVIQEAKTRIMNELDRPLLDGQQIAKEGMKIAETQARLSQLQDQMSMLECLENN